MCVRDPRWLFGSAAGAVLMVGFAIALLLLSRPQADDCQPVLPSPNNAHGTDLAYLKSHNRQVTGSIGAASGSVTRRFLTHDSRNFAVQVSAAEYATAFGLPLADQQNVLHGSDPTLRVILVFSYGNFEWPFTGDTAASVSAMPNMRYRVAMGALDAHSGDVNIGEMPACK